MTWTSLEVYFLNRSYLNIINIILKNKKFISLIYFYKFPLQSFAVVQDICPSSGSVEVIYFKTLSQWSANLIRREERLRVGGGREEGQRMTGMFRWTKLNKVYGHLTTKCLSTACQEQHGSLGLIPQEYEILNELWFVFLIWKNVCYFKVIAATHFFVNKLQEFCVRSK